MIIREIVRISGQQSKLETSALLYRSIIVSSDQVHELAIQIKEALSG